ADGPLAGGGVGQVVTQLIAAASAAVFTFVLSLVLVKLIDVLFGLITQPQFEILGLDRTEHGEVGFDFGPELEMVPAEHGATEPKAATHPPDGQERFTIVVDGANADELVRAWSDLCQAR